MRPPRRPPGAASTVALIAENIGPATCDPAGGVPGGCPMAVPPGCRKATLWQVTANAPRHDPTSPKG